MAEDRAIHQWYRFVLSFPSHLVRTYLERFEATPSSVVLDPFCGTGTVLVECKKLGIPSVGIEANPLAHLASTVKTDWSPAPHLLLQHASAVASEAASVLASTGIEDTPAIERGSVPAGKLLGLPSHIKRLLLSDSISPLPLHKTLVLLSILEAHRDDRYYHHELLALANVIACTASNLYFGPEVGVGRIKSDAPVVSSWLATIQAMADDLANYASTSAVSSNVHLGDARQPEAFLEPASIDTVITSPPYPNEKDYTRTTRLESVLLGFIENRSDLQALKKQMIRSNTRGVYKGDDDDAWIDEVPDIHKLAEEIESRRVQLGKTSGFERMYPRVTKLYFGGMARHLASLRGALRDGARLAYVVGDQASYLRVLIRTGRILADIAQRLGYEVVGIDLFRTRLATATKAQLREEVLLLRWPGRRSAAGGLPCSRVAAPVKTRPSLMRTCIEPKPQPGSTRGNLRLMTWSLRAPECLALCLL